MSEKQLKIKIDAPKPTKEELESLIIPLIPEPKQGEKGKDGAKGKDGKDYKLTQADKREIAKTIKVPIVEKIVERTEIIKEQPIIKEVAINETPEVLKEKILNIGITYEEIKETPNIPEIVRNATIASKTTSLSELDDVNLAGLTQTNGKYNLGSGSSGGQVNSIVAGTNISVDSTDPANPIVTNTQDISGKANTADIANLFNKTTDDTDDITDTATNRFTNDTDITRLADTSGTNTGDQDLSGYQLLSEKGANNGYAELDSTGKVPASQLPAYVDDIVEVANFASLPVTGETGKIYVTIDTNLTYRWSGSAYVEISASLALGETSSTAYRGDRGKIAYDHSQVTTGNPHNVLATQISDFDTEVANNSAVVLNTAKVSNATHTGDVTGATALTIANDVVTNAKMANMAQNTIKGRITASTGDPEDLTASEVRAITETETTTQLNTRDTNNRARANHTGTQTASTISDFQTTVSANTDVTANTTARHTHANKSLLDTYTQTETDIADAISKKHTHSNKTILDNITASFTTAQETKLSYITVTQNVNLDQMEADIAALANGMVYKGDWDASAGTFPGSGSAQVGWFYYIAVAGTVDGVSFAVGDNIVATVDNASATVYASNWSKHDQTDAVQSVNGQVGAVVLNADNIDDTSTTHKFVTSADLAKLSNISVTQAVDLDQIEADTATNNAKVSNATHTGDVTGATALTIANDVVTYAKMQNVSATDKVLGRSTAGSGDVEEIDCTSLGRAIISRTTPLDVRNDINAQENLNSISLSTSTAAVDDKILMNDTSLSNVLRFVTPQTILDLMTFTDTDDIDFTRSTNAVSGVLKKEFISAKTDTVITASDEIIFGDATDSGNLKKDTVQGILDLVSSLPAGAVTDFAGATLPSGWLWCDGSVISRTTYADLFTAIGTTYGAGDGSTTFALPDARGRVTAGKDNMDNTVGTGGGDAGRLTSASKAAVDGDTLGASGGVQQHTLLHEESGVPAHSHPYLRHNTVTRTSSGANTAGAGSVGATTSDNAAADAAQAHTNVQPTLVLNKIIKI